MVAQISVADEIAIVDFVDRKPSAPHWGGV
jgi:hypothetical protein